MLKGLPASGKSTYAKELVKKGWKRVNKDDLRAMIDDGKWSKSNEKFVVDIRNQICHSALVGTKNIVVDDTNFHPEHEKNLREIADMYGAEFEIKFFDTPVEECIERDANRTVGQVGRQVIMAMHVKYLEKGEVIEGMHIKYDKLRKKSNPEPEYNPKLPSCFIFDIDGTLAKMNGRSPFDWSKVGTDLPNTWIVHLYKLLMSKKDMHKLFIFSGRDGSCRLETEEWLLKKGIENDGLFMRPEGDSRKDVEIKKELYENYIKGKYNVVGVFDDRDQVVELWRSLGLTCLQVDYGNF